jgi:hypothetical protein
MELSDTAGFQPSSRRPSNEVLNNLTGASHDVPASRAAASIAAFTPARRSPDEILETLVDTLRATVRHPDEEIQALAKSTLAAVHRIQDIARRELLAQERKTIGTRLQLIVEHVACAFRMRPEILLSRAKDQRTAIARQLAVFLGRKITGASFPTMAEYFGRDHSTLIYSCQIIERRLAREHVFGLSIAKLERQIAWKLPITTTELSSTPPSSPGAGLTDRLAGSHPKVVAA